MAAASSSRVRTENDFDEITGFVSSSTTLRQQPYDVFINHRGPDVKSKLASPIYHVLDLLKVKAFFDLEELELADSLPQALQNAIRSALIHIAIFSKDYAASPWCLEELSCMLKSGAPIIPVFYDVEPANLKRWTREMYADAFSKHEKQGRYKPETLGKWKSALHEVAFRDGCIVKSDSEDEGVLLKKIVNRVQREIMEVKMPFELPSYAVGLDDAVQGFDEIRSAQVHQRVQIVGIVGIAGCGKTTLARKLCNIKCSSFDSYCFLPEVREADLHVLQRKLLDELLNLRDIPPSKDGSQLKSTLFWRLETSSRRVLIVLDNVDRLDQLNDLLPDKGRSLGLGSLIIVTTRDPSVLEPWGISIYEMGALDPLHAKKLFCWHAFLEPSPPPDFEVLVQEFLKTCQGLPFFIEVIAGMLHGKPKEEWRSNLDTIPRTYQEKIEEKLRPIYEALHPEEKHIFLDVACFFVGEKKKLATAVWEAAKWSGLENLVNKCLVEVDKQNRIRMNNILRDLGRQIATERSPHRLWSPGDITRIKRCREQGTSIRGIMAATTQFVKCSAHYEFPKCCVFYQPPFKECINLGSWNLLELLVVARNCFTSEFGNLSVDLVWLRWFNFQHKNLPSWLSLTKLRVLELYGASRLQDLWENNAHAQPPKELREMIITATKGNIFPRFPSEISGLKHLTKIALISYKGEEFRFTGLPNEFCDLESLEHLELRHCKQLSTLPPDFGKLIKLRHLDLWSCLMLRKLPDSFEQLENLEYLDLSGCKNLSFMPRILVKMTKLENLYLSGIPKLQKLPLNKSLRRLHLKDTYLKDVPDDIGLLSKLETLVIGSPYWTGFPTSLGNLSSLTRLKITRCDNLEFLPESVKHLKRLEYLCIKSTKVRSLPEGFRQLTNLQILKICYCPIAELDFGSGSSSSLGKLKVIHLKSTSVTKVSISQDCCPNLQTLRIEPNDTLMELEILPKSVKVYKRRRKKTKVYERREKKQKV